MQAMPNGGTINVAIRANDKIVAIDFEDEGQGITDDVLDKIWDPFFTTKEMGTGLGLARITLCGTQKNTASHLVTLRDSTTTSMN